MAVEVVRLREVCGDYGVGFTALRKTCLQKRLVRALFDSNQTSVFLTSCHYSWTLFGLRLWNEPRPGAQWHAPTAHPPELCTRWWGTAAAITVCSPGSSAQSNDRYGYLQGTVNALAVLPVAVFRLLSFMLSIKVGGFCKNKQDVDAFNCGV